MGRMQSTFFGSKLRIAGTVVLALVVVVAAGFLLGVFGVPTVTGVGNQFGGVNNSTTTIETDLQVDNPNPVGVSLGGTSVNYTVFMNDVAIASGQKNGVQLDSGESSLNFTTFMQNEQIPRWWYTHVRGSGQSDVEQTNVLVDARVRSSLLGQTFELPQEKTVETDIIGGFDSDETTPVNADRPLVSDPVLYINSTSAEWDRDNLSPERTPINMTFTVYNPKPYPYAVTEIGYNITMNGVPVGEGGTQEEVIIPPGETRTIHARTVIDNERLDDWWVAHLQNDQVTQLRIDFSMVVDPDTGGALGEDAGEITVPLERVDYERTIETDIFGNKAESATDGDDGSTGDQQTTTRAVGDRTTTDGGTTEQGTDDGGLLDDSTSTPTQAPTRSPTSTLTSEPTPTPTPSPEPTPPGTTTTDDGLLELEE